MPGPDLEAYPPLAPERVAGLRKELGRHVRNQVDDRFCRCGSYWPCEVRLDIANTLVSAGYKTVASTLDVRLRLADELRVIGYDPVNGKARQPARVGGVGLGAGLLAELMLAGNIRIWDGTVLPEPAGPAPVDPCAGWVLWEIGRETNRLPLAMWIEYLARDADQRISNRLQQQGLLRPVLTPRLLREPVVRWKPADWPKVAWRAERLRTLLEEHQSMELPDIVLTELVLAMGLEDRILGEHPDNARAHQKLEATRMSAPFHHLAAVTRELAKVALLNH